MRTQKGFSLIEILFVVVVIAVLSAIAVTQYQSAVDKSRFTALIPTAKAFGESQEMHYMTYGMYTDDMSELEVKIEGATGHYATLPGGAIVEIGLDDEYRFVKVTRENLDNNYIMYQANSNNYPGEIHCEALVGSSRAQRLCKNMGGREISGNLTAGYTTYILHGDGAGVPASFEREAGGPGSFQSCDSYPCTQSCNRPVANGYECSATYQEDHSYSERVCQDGICVTKSYDPNGKATSKSVCKENEETGVCKEMAQVTYDANGHVLENHKNCLTFDEDGSCKFFGNKTINTYDENGRVISSQNYFTASLEVYDENGRLISEINQYGSGTTYTYNEKGQLISEASQYGSSYNTYTYDENGRLISKTDQYGRSPTYTYNEEGQLISETTQYGSTYVYTYDENGLLISSITKFGESISNNTTYTYDENGRLIAEVPHYGSSYTYTYDENGRLISKTDQQGNGTTYTYDENGNLRFGEKNMLGDNASYGYDEYGGMTISKTDGYGRSTMYSYDENGRLRTDPQTGCTYTYGYDDNGRLISETGPYGRATTYGYDENGRLISEARQYGSSYTYTYDTNGHLISKTDQQGNSTTYGYDDDGRMISQTTQYGSIYTYTYDEYGNLTSASSNGSASYFASENTTIDQYGCVREAY